MKRSKDIWLDHLVSSWRALPASERARQWADYMEERGMLKPITACCATCRFWASDEGDYGDCRKLPPVVVGGESIKGGETVFPNTDSTTWCGSWECGYELERQSPWIP